MRTCQMLILLFLLLAAENVHSQKSRASLLDSPTQVSEVNTARIRLHSTFYRPYVTVRKNEVRMRLPKSEFFGYVDASGKTYRFYHGSEYEVLNPGEEILLYMQESIRIKSDPYAEGVSWHFSLNDTSPVHPLSLADMRRAFRRDTVMLDLMDVHFRQSSDLLLLDETHAQYKINRVLELRKAHAPTPPEQDF